MSLIAGQIAVIVAPFHPDGHGLCNKQIGDSLAVIGLYAGGLVVGLIAKESGHVRLDGITAQGLELLEEIGRPIRDILVGVLEDRVEFWLISGEWFVKPLDVMRDRVRIERIEHVTFAAGSGALDHHGGWFL